MGMPGFLLAPPAALFQRASLQVALFQRLLVLKPFRSMVGPFPSPVLLGKENRAGNQGLAILSDSYYLTAAATTLE